MAMVVGQQSPAVDILIMYIGTILSSGLEDDAYEPGE